MQFQSFLGGIYIIDRFYITLGRRNCYDRAIYTSIFLGEGGLRKQNVQNFWMQVQAWRICSILALNQTWQWKRPILRSNYIHRSTMATLWQFADFVIIIFLYPCWQKDEHTVHCAIPMHSLFRLFMKLVFIHIHSTLCKSNMAIENHLLMAVWICFNGNIPFFNGWFPPISWMTSSFPRFPEGPGAAAMVLACVLRIKISSSGNLDLLSRRTTVLCFSANDGTIFKKCGRSWTYKCQICKISRYIFLKIFIYVFMHIIRYVYNHWNDSNVAVCTSGLWRWYIL